MKLLQIETSTDTVKEVFSWSEEVRVIGVLSAVIIALVIALVYIFKLYYQNNKLLLTKSEAYSSNLQAIGEKFMLQTNKMMLVLELLKNKNNG